MSGHHKCVTDLAAERPCSRRRRTREARIRRRPAPSGEPWAPHAAQAKTDIAAGDAGRGDVERACGDHAIWSEHEERRRRRNSAWTIMGAALEAPRSPYSRRRYRQSPCGTVPVPMYPGAQSVPLLKTMRVGHVEDWAYCGYRLFGSLGRFPTYKQYGCVFLSMIDPAPMTQPSATVTPGRMIALA